MAYKQDIGYWIDARSGQGYSGPKKSPFDKPTTPPSTSRTLPETPTGGSARDLLAEPETTGIKTTGDIAGQVGQSASQLFGTKLMDLMLRYQGLGTKPYEEAGLQFFLL